MGVENTKASQSVSQGQNEILSALLSLIVSGHHRSPGQ